NDDEPNASPVFCQGYLNRIIVAANVSWRVSVAIDISRFSSYSSEAILSSLWISDRKRPDAYCSWQTGIKRFYCPMAATAQLSYISNGKGQNKHYATQNKHYVKTFQSTKKNQKKMFGREPKKSDNTKYYEVLGVPQSTPDDELKNAYRKAEKHPKGL
ncbi:DnaJ protein, partial [Tanacetum coccineum]